MTKRTNGFPSSFVGGPRHGIKSDDFKLERRWPRQPSATALPLSVSIAKRRMPEAEWLTANSDKNDQSCCSNSEFSDGLTFRVCTGSYA